MNRYTIELIGGDSVQDITRAEARRIAIREENKNHNWRVKYEGEYLTMDEHKKLLRGGE